MGAVTVEQQKLVLNSFAQVLQNNLTTSQAVTWNEMDGEMDDMNGMKVLEQTTPRYNVTRTENGVKDLTAGTQGSVFGSELFEITGTFGADMGWGDFQAIRDIGTAKKSKALLGAASSMAARIDAYILQIATLGSSDWVGDGITSIDEWLDAAAAHTRLTENGVEDMELSYLMAPVDRMKLGDSVIKLPAPDAFSTSTFRKGFTGEVNDIKTMFTNQLPTLTTGTRLAAAEATVNAAAQNVDYATVAKAGAVNGRRMTQSLVLSNAGVKTYKAGEVFTIAGVFAYDNRKQSNVTPARLQQFTVIADATAVAGAVTLTIFPAIIVPGTGAGDNIAINTAHATVNAAPAASALLTFLGAASTLLSPRLLIQKSAVVVNTMQLVLPAGNEAAGRTRLPRIPLSVRMWPNSDFNTGAHGVRFDVAINANIRDRSRMVRFNGS
jgi:hypothetical protein